MRAFEESGIEIAGIAGTSMGAVVGGLYASGYTPDEIEEITGDIDLGTLFSNSPRRRALFLTQRENIDQALITLRLHDFVPTIPTELSAAQRVTEMLSLLTVRESYLAGNDFTRMRTPFKTVATDMETGQAITLAKGNLAESIRASMAFPLAISAVELDGRLLTDGGMMKPVPVDLARSLLDGPGYVVASNTTMELLPKEKISNAFEVANQVTTIMSNRELAEQLSAADFVITPPVRDRDGADFSRAREFSALGYTAAGDVIDSILGRFQSDQAHPSVHVSPLVLGGDRSAIEPLAEILLSMDGPVSPHFLDSLLALRWSKGDLLTLSAKSATADSDNERKLVIEATKSPDVNHLTINILADGQAVDESIVREILRKTGELGRLDIDSVASWTIERYRKNGSELCAIRTCAYDAQTQTLTVTVDEGRVWRLVTNGLKRTRPSFIRDRVHFNPGENYSLKAIEDSYRDIYGSGLFKRVAIDITPSDSGATVHVSVEEQNSLLVKFGYRWDQEYHSEGFIEILENHLFGIGLEALGRVHVSERRKRYLVGLRTDRFFRTYLGFDLQAYAAKHDRRLFDIDGAEEGFRDEDRLGISLRLSQQIARFGVASIRLRIETVETFKRVDSTNEDYELRTLKLSSSVEDFDRTYFPTEGRKHLFTFESAGKVFGGVTEYNKWYFSVERYFPLKKRLNFHPRFIAATSSAALPGAERFYIGGLGSFEGFRSQELSGAKIFLVNLEARYRIFPITYLFARYNIGNTFEQTDDISLVDVKSGWAALVAFDTPAGPFTFGYGRANGGLDRFYFNAGLKF